MTKINETTLLVELSPDGYRGDLIACPDGKQQ